MIYIAGISVFIVLLIVIHRILIMILGNKIQVENRMEYIEGMDKQQYYDENLSFGERVIIPFFNVLGRRFTSLSPEYNIKHKKILLERAGLLKNTTYERLIAKRWMLTLVLAMFFGLLLSIVKVATFGIFFMMMWVVLFMQIIYRFTTKSAIDKRSKQMVRDLPYTLDLITVSVEAGLSLDGAIGRIVSNIPGVLSEEFSKTLKEMRMGIDKKHALRNMSDRCDVKDLSILINALIQADELGVSLGKVLRIEGAQLREKRRQVAKEKAMKAPIKILFPLMIFIFPAIFVIILGPAVIKVMEMF
jgi:Flp pilus assembly protein TadB